MRVRGRLINGAFNAVTDLLFLILMLILYALLSSFLTHTTPNILALIQEYIALILAFAIIAFLRGALAGHVLVYPVLLGEFVLVTAIFASVSSTMIVHGVLVNVQPIIYFVWAIEAAWIVYSVINQLNEMIKDP